MEQFVVRWNRRYASPVDIFPLTVWLFGHYCELSCHLIRSFAHPLYHFVCWLSIQFAAVRVLDIFCFVHWHQSTSISSIRLFSAVLSAISGWLGWSVALNSSVYITVLMNEPRLHIALLCLFLFTSFVTSFFAVLLFGLVWIGLAQFGWVRFVLARLLFWYSNRQFYLLSSFENNDNCFNSVYYKYLLHYRICLMFFTAYLVVRLHLILPVMKSCAVVAAFLCSCFR